MHMPSFSTQNPCMRQFHETISRPHHRHRANEDTLIMLDGYVCTIPTGVVQKIQFTVPRMLD